MAIVAITRLRLRAWRFLPAFVWHTHWSTRQAQRAPGFLGGRVGIQRDRTFWTLTMWEDDAAMRAYRSRAAHGAAMPNLNHWCDEAAVAHWPCPSEAALPSWESAHQQMVMIGRLSPVAHPSERQRAGVIAAPALLSHGDRLLLPQSTRHDGEPRPPRTPD